VTAASNNDGPEVPPIAEWETLARAVTDGDEAKYAANKGAVHPGSFTRLGRQDISVDRFSRMERTEAVKNGHAVAAERGANRRFHGWALITKTAVDDLGYMARESRIDGHNWHADIWLPEQAATNAALHQHHAATLARHAEWKEKPSEGN
jgi:hypothetical protein